MITVETILKASEEQVKKYLELNKNCAKRFVNEKSVCSVLSQFLFRQYHCSIICFFPEMGKSLP